MRETLLCFAAVSLFACGGSVTAPTPTPTPAPPGPPVLLTPAANAVIPQNNPNSGCPFDVMSGAGIRIDFDWADVTAPGGLAGYEILVQRQQSELPLVNTATTVSEYHFQRCGSYAAGANLDGWVWKVRAVDRLGQFGPWAERSFSYAPCRIGDRYCGS